MPGFLRGSPQYEFSPECRPKPAEISESPGCQYQLKRQEDVNLQVLGRTWARSVELTGVILSQGKDLGLAVFRRAAEVLFAY